MERSNAVIEANQYLQAILDSAPYTILATDCDGIIKIFNHHAEKELQYFAAELIDKLAPEIIHIESEIVERAKVLTTELGYQVDPGFDVFIEKIRNGGIDEHEWSFVRKDGSIFPALLSITVVKNSNGTTVGYMGIARDMSERKEFEGQIKSAQQMAENANDAKSLFLANMSHEIRTPINGLMGILELLSDGHLENEQQKLVDVARRSSDSLLMIVNDILDFSKVEQGIIELESITFNIVELLENICNSENLVSKDNNLKVLLNIAKNSHGWVKGDPTRIRQVLTNLLSNAVKFTPQGNISISYTSELLPDNRIKAVFKVEDSGIGISEDKIPILFDSFTQADVSTTRRFGGTGLGLAICKKLVGLMGGEIFAYNLPEKGCCFEFYIELQTASARIDTTISREKNINNRIDFSSLAGIRILLVEDNTVNQLVVKSILDRVHIICDIASQGQEALEKLSETKEDNIYDLVLMDCQMPLMDGYTATKKIRKGEVGQYYKSVPILALTANAMIGDREECLECGMNDVITKPFKHQKLLKTIIKYV